VADAGIGARRFAVLDGTRHWRRSGSWLSASSPSAATTSGKCWKIIDRFSEDIDLTYDIRKLIGDLTGGEEFLPASRSQASKWTKAVRDRLPEWIAAEVQPLVKAALEREQLEAKLEIGGTERDKLLLHYPAIKQGTGYVPPVVTLEFGGRSTGEPHQVLRPEGHRGPCLLRSGANPERALRSTLARLGRHHAQHALRRRHW